MAGPLMPLRVNSRFSSKRTPLQDATQGMDNPESSRQNSKSGPLKVKGTRPGCTGVTFRPNFSATSWAKRVAPIWGIDWPPVAMTSELAVTVARDVSMENRLFCPQFCFISVTSHPSRMVTPARSHSVINRRTISWEEPLQKS